MSSQFVPKEQLSAYQRWEMNSFDVNLPTADDVERIHLQARQEGYSAGYQEGNNEVFMRKYTQIERVLQIISWLANGHHLTASILEQRFNFKVSKRDLQRDLNHIFDSGLPIAYDTKGREKIWYFDQSSYRERMAKMFVGLSKQNNQVAS